MTVVRGRLQLLGVSCMLVAAKFEENDTAVRGGGGQAGNGEPLFDVRVVHDGGGQV